MTAPVTFDPTAWKAAFPEFVACSDAQANSWFARASFICGNEACNPLNAVTGRLQMMLWLLTAHIGWLNAPRDANDNPASTGSPGSPIVGRIDQASEGSVSVHADMGDATAGSPSQPWYMQTKYGSEYWYGTADMRTARYVARPTVVLEPVYPGLYRNFGFY